MAGPTPREVFLANMLGRAVVLAEGASRVSLETLWYGRLVWPRAGDHLWTAGGTDFQFPDQQRHLQIGGLQYLRIINPATHLSVEFGRLIHQVRSPRTLGI